MLLLINFKNFNTVFKRFQILENYSKVSSNSKLERKSYQYLLTDLFYLFFCLILVRGQYHTFYMCAECSKEIFCGNLKKQVELLL